MLALDALDRAFYTRHGPDFDRQRRAPWPGWHRLLPFVPPSPTVLDAGAGNGRLAAFLRSHARPPRRYLGVDRSLPLVAATRSRMEDLPLVAADLAALPLSTPPIFDLVALLGVLHHLPGRARRAAVLRALAASVARGGHLVLTAWDVLGHPDLAARIVPWEGSGVLVDPEDLEPGDHLVAWGDGGAVRYYHLLDDDELDSLLAPLGLREVERFRADGRNGRLNRYRVLRRPAAADR